MNDGGVSEVLDAARSYADAGNLLLAAEKFNEAVIVYPSNATAWYGLGVVQANRGMTNEAIDAFENSHSISPGHGATAANLAVLLESSNPKRASKMARMAVKIVGDVDELVRISRLFDHTEAQEEVMLEAAPVEEEVMLEAAPVEEEVMLEAAPVEEEVMLEAAPVEEEVFIQSIPSTTLNDLIDTAREMLRNGEAADALELVKPRLQTDGSDDPMLWSICGTCLSMVGNEVEAIQAMEYSISIGEDTAKTHYNLAQLLRRNGRKVDAMQSLANALLSDSEHVNSLIALGEMRLEAGNSDEAISIWNRALGFDPENSISERILELESKNNIEDVEEEPEAQEDEQEDEPYEVQVSIEDTMANRISIARELSESGDHVSAVNAWKILLEEDRQSSDIWNGMADALSAAGHVDRAFQCSQRAKAIEEAIANDEEIEIEEGAIDLITAGEEAKERLDNIEPTENEDVNISIEWYNRGVGLLGEGQPIEALNCFEKAIGSAPREELSLRVKSQGGRGHALYQLGRYGDSIRSYHTAISMDPSGVTARMLYNMGSSYAALELFEDAIKCFTQSMQRGLDDEDNELCRKQISRCKILAKEQSRRVSN